MRVSVHVRARVMGSYSESEKASQHREMLSNAVAALLLSGRNRQRRFPGTTLMMHGAPALVLAQHLGRNLRFKGSPVCDRPPSSILRHQCRSRQAPSEHARPVLGQRTTVVIEQIPCLCGLCADISVRNVRPHNARARTCLKSWFNDGAPSFLYREICNGQLRLEPPLPLFYLDSIWLKSQS